MKELRITEGLKGIIIFAKNKAQPSSDWLVLVSAVRKHDEIEDLCVDYFFCLDTDFNSVYFSEEGNLPWAFCSHFNFYQPTKEQKIVLLKELARMGYKYVSALGKLVKKI